MIQIASADMEPALKQLWQLCFDDSQAEVETLFQHLSVDHCMVQRTKAGEPIAMLWMEPMQLVGTSGTENGIYLYGFGVHPEYRGRGVGEKLLRKYDKIIKASGYAATVLRPIWPDYFRNSGYYTQFVTKQVTIATDAVTSDLLPQQAILLPRDLEFFSTERNAFYTAYAELSIRWSETYLFDIGQNNKRLGGESLRVQFGNEKGFLSYQLLEDTAIISEFAVPPQYAQQALSLLCERFIATSGTAPVWFILQLPVNYPVEFPVFSSEILPFAMIKWYDERNIHIHPTRPPYVTSTDWHAEIL